VCPSPLQPIPTLVPAAVLSHPLQDNLCASVFCIPPAPYFRSLSLFRIHCTYSLVIFDHAPVAQRPHANQPTEFRRRPKQTVPSGHADAPRCRSSCSARQTGMSRPRHFDRQVQQFPCSHCMLLGGRCELVTRRNAPRTPRGGFVHLLLICSKTVWDMKGIYSQALIPFQPGMRGAREKTPRCTSIKVRSGCVGLLTEWLILGDRTEAADYTKLWNDLRESISFVKGGKSQPCTKHVWTRLWLRRRSLWVSPTTIDLTPQSATDALCKNVLATRTRSFLPCTCTRQCSRRIHWALLWGMFTRTRLSWWAVARTRRSHFRYMSHF
jgi:hypothetical protein